MYDFKPKKRQRKRKQMKTCPYKFDAMKMAKTGVGLAVAGAALGYGTKAIGKAFD